VGGVLLLQLGSPLMELGGGPMDQGGPAVYLAVAIGTRPGLLLVEGGQLGLGAGHAPLRLGQAESSLNPAISHKTSLPDGRREVSRRTW
jgi:hypothetical protein